MTQELSDGTIRGKLLPLRLIFYLKLHRPLTERARG